MSRAELRRQNREKSQKTVTYNLTKKQIEKIKQDAREEAVGISMELLLTLPLEVLMDYYWPKTYKKKIPEFTSHVLEYYSRWENGELDMDKLREDLWIYGGVRIERDKSV